MGASNELPQLWGTRRIGPDLAREGARRTQDWQLVHLYNPRYIVPDSIMPSYPWLFAGEPEAPSQDAVAVVAYLQTLGRQSPSPTEEEPVPGGDDHVASHQRWQRRFRRQLFGMSRHQWRRR